MTKANRIVHVVALADWAVLRKIILDLAKHATPSGMESHILVLSSSDQANLPKDNSSQCQYLALPAGWLQAIGVLRKWFQGNHVGLLHIHDVRYLSIATWAAWSAMRPSIVTLHSAFEHKGPSFVWCRHRKIIFAWQYVKDAVLKGNKIPLNKMAVYFDG